MEGYESDEQVMDDSSASDDDEEVDYDNMEDEGEAADGVNAKVRGGKKGGDPRYALPTPDEQRALRQTSELMTSNILTMETSELLDEVRPNYKASVESYLKELHGLIMRVTPQEVTADDLPPSIQLMQRHNKELALSFMPPERLDIVGSFLLRSVCKPNFNIDLGITMPSACFLPKDYLNYRYFDKRALYVWHLCKYLMEECSHLCGNVTVFNFKGDVHKPCIEFTPLGIKTKFTIRIIPLLNKGTFPFSKLTPDRNNVRRKTHEGEPQPATPLYNSGIAEDMLMRDHLALLHSVVLKCPAFNDAIMLIKVWLTQRCGSSHQIAADDFGGFLCSMILLWLFQSKLLNNQMNSLQIFKIFMEKVSTMDFAKERLVLKGEASEGEDCCPADVAAVYPHIFSCVLLDPSGWLNIAARVSSSALANIQHEATLCNAAISTNGMDSFESVFMTQVSFWLKYDQYITISIPAVDADTELPLDDSNATSDTSYAQVFKRKIGLLVTKALGDRAKLIRCVLDNDGKEPIDALSDERQLPQAVIVGLLLAEDDLSGRRIDKGPAADDVALSGAFRAFWGNKSELRKFKDGTITETLVWSGDKHTIPGSIVKYIVSRHIPSVVAESIRVVATQLDPWLTGGTRLLDETAAAINAFNAFADCLKGLSNLPMSIKEVNCTSSYLRYTSINPVDPHPLVGGSNAENATTVSSIVNPLSCVITFSVSTRWPDDVKAIDAVKSALFVKISEALDKLKIETVISRSSLIVLWQGFAYKCVIYHNREITILDTLGDKESAEKSQELQINCEYRPVIASALRGFHWKFTAFGPTARLAKRWIASHLLSPHFSEECIELIVAHIFLSAAPLSPPASALVGFSRFLRLLATFSWREFPLIVDLNDEITSTMRGEIEDVFANHRATASRGGCAMYIVTSADKSKGWKPVWTMDGPDNAVLSHTIKIAHGCSNIIHKAIAGEVDEDAWATIFTPSIKVFDAFLVCKESSLPPVHSDEVADVGAKRGKLYKVKVYKNLMAEARQSLMYGFNPLTTYYNQLVEKFGNFAIFFYDDVAGDRIGVVWKPTAFLPKDFAVSTASHTVVLHDKVTVPNIVSILTDIAELGSGLLQSVVLP